MGWQNPVLPPKKLRCQIRGSYAHVSAYACDTSGVNHPVPCTVWCGAVHTSGNQKDLVNLFSKLFPQSVHVAQGLGS